MSTSTRAAARQQEQEEQLGKLVSLVENQIKGLEVAEEQKRQRGVDGGAAGDCLPTAGRP